MNIECIWEHNGDDTLLYSVQFPGAFARGRDKKAAAAKMAQEIRSYAAWLSIDLPYIENIEVVQEASCELEIRDADSDVLFDSENEHLTKAEYELLKDRALKSASDFLKLYEAIPDKARPLSPARKTFYGQVPRTAEEMYQHTKSVNSYYFAEINVEADSEGTILDCRRRALRRWKSGRAFFQTL